MVLESTVICVDNSEFMRNGDFVPTRLLAQQDAVNMLCTSKTRSNPENTVALMTLSNLKVLSTLTTEVAKVMSSLHQIEPHGEIQFLTGLKIAHLALKHRQSKNHKTRIVLFIGSPVDDDDRDLTRLAKKLKKEKVSVDIVNFGETDDNTEKLTAFIDTLNGKDGTGSHIVTISMGPNISDALMKSPILAGEDMPLNTGGSFDFIDPNTDPELALALRVSLEEQRQRQEEENKGRPETVEEDTPMMNVPDPNTVDISQLSEEEQIALAMQMSLAGCKDDDVVKTTAEATSTPPPTQTSSVVTSATTQATAATSSGATVTTDLDDVMADPEFLKQVLTDLPGVDPTSEAVKSVMGNIQKGSKNKKDDDDGEGESAAKKPRKDDTN